jgi:hypothetical protein
MRHQQLAECSPYIVGLIDLIVAGLEPVKAWRKLPGNSKTHVDLRKHRVSAGSIHGQAGGANRYVFATPMDVFSASSYRALDVIASHISRQITPPSVLRKYFTDGLRIPSW